MTNKRTSDAIDLDDLLQKVVKEQFGKRTRIMRTFQDDKKTFLAELFKDGININPRKPVETSKNIVDVNEKIYSNCNGDEDETAVKIVNTVENTEGHNYQATVTKGIEWGLSTNVGLQFGLPQVGIGLSGGGSGSFQRQLTKSFFKEEKQEDRVELQSHHEETVKIPPGKMVVLKMTSYRVRYKLEYTMEYKISKLSFISVRVRGCVGVPLCTNIKMITATQLMQSLPGYREDEDFVYVTQEGELRWIADRMVVNKTLMDI